MSGSLKVARVGLGILVVLALYHRFVRPRHVHWGATLDETRRRLPGDDDVSHPYVVTTRAVSIDARPDQVWPWLVQIGAGRGGLYSYEWLDRMFGYTPENSADEILPEFQHLEVGDVIPMGRGPSWPVVVVDPQRALVVAGIPGRVSWCFALFPTDTGTRLVSRVRMRLYQRLSVWLLAPAIDMPWFLMERKMLLGIKTRAESLNASVSAPSLRSNVSATTARTMD